MDWVSWRARPDWREAPGCTGRIYIRDGESNGAPAFADGAGTTRKVAENTAPGKPVGKPVTAEDPNDDPVTYTLEGPMTPPHSDIDAETGQLRNRKRRSTTRRRIPTQVTVTATDDRDDDKAEAIDQSDGERRGRARAAGDAGRAGGLCQREEPGR